MRLIVLLFLLTFQYTGYAFTFGSTSSLSQPSFLPVDQAFQLSVGNPEQGKFIATWHIKEGYYLYQKQFRFTGKDADKLHFAPFPKGEEKTDIYYGDVIVYRNQLSLPIYYDVQLPQGTVINAALSYQGCADKGLCYPPQSVPILFTVPAKTTSNQNIPSDAPSLNQTIDTDLPISPVFSIRESLESSSVWGSVMTIFGLGLLLSLTPCVLPMVPIVSAIVVGTRHSRLGAFYYSSVYVLGMALTYAAIGAMVGFLGIQFNLQAQMQNPILLLSSALIFILLALIMFGVIAIRLPSKWQAKVSTYGSTNLSPWKSSLSIFATGVLSTLIVSPCVSAPLAGVLMYITSQQDAGYGALMLFIMALGMGAPLLLVAMFGTKILPKSGHWLEDIKTVMGFALLGMAIWLMTRWLPDSTHLYLWGLLAFSVSAYFLHRALTTSSHPIRWFFAILFFVIGSLQWLGGATGNRSPLIPLENLTTTEKLTPPVTFDAVITRLDELNDIIAKQDNRPIVLDLYADWCISCKVLEDMFNMPDVSPLLDQVQLIRVDVTENSPSNQALMQHFGLFGPPSLVFLNKQGQEEKDLRLIGEPSKQHLMSYLNAITTR